MRQYEITLGGLPTEGVSFGEFAAETPEAALLAALLDADRHRRYETPVLLSNSPGYGRGAQTTDGAGNGAADRSDWWYVTEGDTLVGVYTVAEESY